MEGMIAIALIAIALGPLLSSMQSSQKAISEAKLQALAVAHCEAKCEEMRFRMYHGLHPVYGLQPDEWATGAVRIDPEGNFIGSYTIATFSDFPVPLPNNIATLYRFDLEVLYLPGWASFTTPITDLEPYRDPDRLGIATQLTAFFGRQEP